MTAILFYANYDNNSTSIIRTHFICPVTNLAYANTFVTNLITNLSQRPMLWTVNLIKFYHSDDGHFVHECASVLHNTHVNHKGND